MDDLVDEREEHYRNVNEELNEKATRLIEEANSLINNVTLSVATPIPDEPSTVEASQAKSNVTATEPGSGGSFPNEDHLPEAISKLGTNAKTRYLAAKVRVLEEENAKLQVEVRSSHDEIAKLSSQLQEVSHEKAQLRRQLTQNSSHLERLRVDVDETKRRAETLTLEKTSMERELEVSRREREKEKVGARTTDAKLQRALDESERLRGDLERARADADAARRQAESITNENRRLERQKAELIAGFKKQMKLIDVLRRQKMLIEASRALKLTEEEFLKALDWQMG